MKNAELNTQVVKAKRESGIELLRILAMFMIVAHHFVNNSGITYLYDYANPSLKMFWFLTWGMWGKTAINIFVLITGYFMCTQDLTVKRFFKLFFEIMLYRVVMYFVMVLAGYEALTFNGVMSSVAWMFTGVNKGFTSSFIWFYLMIPFYNIFIRNSSAKQQVALVSVLLGVYTVSATFFFNVAVFDFVGWYVTLYLIGALLRLHPLGWMSKNKYCIAGLAACVFCVFSFVGVVYYVASKIHRAFINPNHFTEDSNKLLALLTAVFALLVFKNLKIGYKKWINIIASTTFGVLLIHAANEGVRIFIWKDIFNAPQLWQLDLLQIVLASIGIPAIVFVACSLIDYIRIRFLEGPLMRILFH